MTAFVYCLAATFCGVVTIRAAIDIRSNLFKAGVFAGLGIIHGLVPAITPTHLLEMGFSPSSRLLAALYVLACVVMLAAGWSVVQARCLRQPVQVDDMIRWFHTPQGQRLLKWLFWWGIAMGILALLLIKKANQATLGEMLRGSRFEFRHTRSPVLYNLGTYLTCFAFIPGLVGFFLSRRYQVLSILFICAYALLTFFVFSKGARSLPLGLLGTFIVAFLMRKRPTVSQLIGLTCATAILMALAVGMYEGRKYMAHQSLLETLQFLLSADAYAGALTRDPLNYNECLVGACHCFPDQHPFVNMAGYRRMLVFFLPSSQFPILKPRDPNIVFGEVVFNTPFQWDVTIPPSIPGDVFINFWGWPGTIVMFFYGMLGAMVDRLVATSPLWFAVIGAQAVRLVLLGMRGQPYDLYVGCLFVMVVGFVIYQIGPARPRLVPQKLPGPCRTPARQFRSSPAQRRPKAA